MNLLGIFKRKPKPPPVPMPIAVRNALKVCVDGMEPEVSLEEFEILYCDVLDAEVNKRDVSEILNTFEKQRRHD